MKFVVDAHLPQRLAYWLNTKGHDAVHTFDLPGSNRTKDVTIADLAINQGRTVVTKDSDFLKMFVLKVSRKNYCLLRPEIL